MTASEWESVGVLVGALQGGRMVETEVYDPEKPKAAGVIMLKPGDEQCSGCGTLIDGDEYPGASWANVLARQKLKYGHTMCRECHQVVAGSG